MNLLIRRLAAVACLLLAPSAFAGPQTFDSTDAAAKAFIAALGTEHADAESMAKLLGDDWQRYIPTAGIEREDVDAFIAHYQQRHRIEADGAVAHLLVGEADWSLPIPLVKDSAGWHFDAVAAAEEIRTRRIGRNEDAVIEAVRAFHDAQMDYAEQDHDGDGVLEYAQRIVSQAGQQDGLYWASLPGEDESPLGPLFGDDLPDGEWQGYRYRILTAQGESAPGGAYDYRIGENMTRGFALVAWPVSYADTGVMSFMISHDGQVFEKDLGPDGGKEAEQMTRFDPDSSWAEVAEGEAAEAE